MAGDGRERANMEGGMIILQCLAGALALAVVILGGLVWVFVANGLPDMDDMP